MWGVFELRQAVKIDLELDALVRASLGQIIGGSWLTQSHFFTAFVGRWGATLDIVTED